MSKQHHQSVLLNLFEILMLIHYQKQPSLWHFLWHSRWPRQCLLLLVEWRYR